MTTPIHIRRQALHLPGTTKVTVSAIEDSTITSGQKIRAVRFHTDDPAVPALEVLIEGASADAIKFTTPELPF